MDLMGIRRRLMCMQTTRLPKEYQEVEWIESTGEQWIDTNILGNAGIKIECRMGWANNKPNNHQLFGSRKTNDATRFFITSYGGIDFAHGRDLPIETVINARQLFDLVYDTTLYTGQNTSFLFKYSVDGVEGSTNVMPINTELNIYLFGTNRTSYTTEKFIYPVIFAGMIITDSNGGELFNGIPCYRKSDGEIGIYDLVTDTFLTNQGTGTFLKGADV